MTLPTVGSSYNTYGTELNAHINVSHDSDGKIKNGAEQTTSAAPTTDAMIANKKYVDDNVGSANYTPTSYAGGESVTFPNGLIWKQGEESVAAFTTDDVTYATAFPTTAVSFSITNKIGGSSYNEGISALPKAGSVASIMQIKNWTSSTQTVYWQAWGY